MEELHRFDHPDEVLSVAASPDGRFLLAGGQDGVAYLWDVKSGDLLRRYRGHRGKVTAVLFTPDGQRAVTGGEDGTICFWRLP